MDREELNERYAEYCRKDGKISAHLPFIIWLKHVAKIDPSKYYKEGKFDCTDCALDGTDACPRGAGRAVDSEVCEYFLKEGE